MTLHYRISNPSDVRDLGEQLAAWQATGNPKADDWAEQPPAPSPHAIWADGAWIDPPAPPPPADWGTFKSVALQSATIAGILGPAYSGAAPQAAGQLPLALAKAEAGQSAEFAVVWAALLQAVPAPPEELAGLVGLAQACHLPEAFIEALDPAPAAGMVRARDEFGRFIPDDPATPEDEAWVQPE